MTRPYDRLAREAEAVLEAPRAERLRRLTDCVWEALAPTGVSWAGFYLPGADGASLTLGPCRDKPACSPIGLHGVCGRAFRARRSVIVRDVAALGADYVACDPRDRSEVVVPLLDASGACAGVLDLDSFEVGAFGAGDAAGLEAMLRAAGLLEVEPPAPLEL
ncbi:MAG: GAF domain-containing protein [Phycisphaerales bacterium JB039]